jgi:hypothetical protein
MQETSRIAQLDQLIGADTITQLAGLYDRAANALDPHSIDRAEAERLLGEELRGIYDNLPPLPPPRIEFRDFKRFVISQCRKHLKATDRPSST